MTIKKLDWALKNIVPDISWIGSGLFSLQQVFWHVDFIVSSMHPDAILFLPPPLPIVQWQEWEVADFEKLRDNHKINDKIWNEWQ